jgi:hypothetical protein
VSIERIERRGGIVWRGRWRDEQGRNRSKVLGRKRYAEAFDDLRHSFVSVLIQEGRSVVEVARQAGHSPKMALDTYAHVFDAQALEDRCRPKNRSAARASTYPSCTRAATPYPRRPRNPRKLRVGGTGLEPVTSCL